jgi:hypothetical protein
MPLPGTLAFSWRQAHGTVLIPNTLAAFEIRSEINYALAVIALFWVKYSFAEHGRSSERTLTWLWQLICLEIIITLVFFQINFHLCFFQHFRLQNNYNNNEFTRINDENSAIILLTSQDTQNNSFTIFSVGFMGDLLLTGKNTPTRLKYLRTESSEEYAEPKNVRLVKIFR